MSKDMPLFFLHYNYTPICAPRVRELQQPRTRHSIFAERNEDSGISLSS